MVAGCGGWLGGSRTDTPVCIVNRCVGCIMCVCLCGCACSPSFVSSVSYTISSNSPLTVCVPCELWEYCLRSVVSLCSTFHGVFVAYVRHSMSKLVLRSLSVASL